MTLPWDELNNIRSRIEQTMILVPGEPGKQEAGFTGLPVIRYDKEKVLDIVYDYLVYAYLMGVDNVNEELSTSIRANDKEMRESIFKKIAGKNFKERVEEYAEQGDLESIMRVAETDAHRNMEDASQKTARKAGAKYKTWRTMGDDRVRDTHDYLEGMKVGIDQKFVTYNGDATMYPGEFGIAEEDCNCRCWLTYQY